MQHPQPLAVLAEKVGVLAVLLDEQVFLQGVDLLVELELATAVEGGGGVGEDFDNQRRMLLGEAGLGLAVARIAGDEDVGVEDGVGAVDAQFHAGDEGAAGLAGEGGA